MIKFPGPVWRLRHDRKGDILTPKLYSKTINRFTTATKDQMYILSESMFPLLDQTMSIEACLGRFYSVDVFQSSVHFLKYAILAPKS